MHLTIELSSRFVSNKWDPYQGLVAGQTCVVRYRLQGACSYYGQGHTVLKDEREPAPGTPKLLGDVQRCEHCCDTGHGAGIR